MNLPPVEVYSVASFYSMLNLQRKGKYVIHVCVSLPCYLRGSKKILETLKDELNIEAGQTTPDKKFTIEAVSCHGKLKRTLEPFMPKFDFFNPYQPKKNVNQAIMQREERRWN